jgi:LPS export ABC transporter protein LptC
MKLSPRVIGIIVALLAVGGIFLLFRDPITAPKPEDKGGKNGSAVQKEAEAGAVGKNVTFTITEAEYKKWDLLVKEARYYPDRTGADLDGVSGKFYNQKGDVMVTFSAPKGVFQGLNKKTGQKNVVKLTGGVSVKSEQDQGMNLTANSMTWANKADQVVADGNVVVEYEGFGTSRADRCRFSLDMSKVALEGNTSSNIQMN